MLDNINGYVEYKGDYKKLEKDLNEKLIAFGVSRDKSRPNMQSYSQYRLYKYKGLSIRYYDKHHSHGRCVYIKGSIRKYYCSVYGKSNINYDLSRVDINTIIRDFKSLNINLDQLELESFEWGLTIESNGDVLSNIVFRNNSQINNFGNNAVEFLSSRENIRSESKKLIFYKPEVSEKKKKASEPTNYLRVEFNVPKQTVHHLKVKDTFGTSDRFKLIDFTGQEAWNHVFEYLLTEIRKIKCTKKLAEKVETMSKKNISKSHFVSKDNYYMLTQYIEMYKSTTPNITNKQVEALKRYYRTILNYESDEIENDTEGIESIIKKLENKYNLVNV